VDQDQVLGRLVMVNLQLLLKVSAQAEVNW